MIMIKPTHQRSSTIYIINQSTRMRCPGLSYPVLPCTQLLSFTLLAHTCACACACTCTTFFLLGKYLKAFSLISFGVLMRWWWHDIPCLHIYIVTRRFHSVLPYATRFYSIPIAVVLSSILRHHSGVRECFLTERSGLTHSPVAGTKKKNKTRLTERRLD